MIRTPDTLADIGRALYGERWQSPLAEALGINRETLRRWLTGSSHLPSDHGVWNDLRDVVREAAAAHHAIASQLTEISEKI